MLTFKIVHEGQMVEAQIDGVWEEGFCRLTLDGVQVKYSAVQCIVNEERAMVARSLAGQVYAKAADQLRRSTIHALEALFNELLGRAAASRQGEGWAGSVGRSGPEDLTISAERVSRLDGDADQGAIAATATVKP